MGLEANYVVRENVLIVRLEGEIDHHESIQLREQWQEYLQKNGIVHVVLNLAGVNFMDSSGIGVVLGRYKEVISKGGELVVCHVTPPVERLFKMAGIYKIIRGEENEAHALLSLGVAS
ncbi:MAG TPA: anti-sigma F factor antagonist [Pseudogracilibacillus sp.]|nr:anti-sigma F factor antagonist [Pseudogracilibacillus sp.]